MVLTPRRTILVASLLALAVCSCGGGGASEGTSPSSTPSVASAPPPSPPPPVTAPAWVAGLAIGQWYEIPSTAMSSVAPNPVPYGSTGPSSKVVAWTSLVVDTRTSKVYSVANGGHNDYAGNEVDALTLETENPFWTEVLASTPSAQIPNPGDGSSYYGDGRPVSRHSYYGVTLDIA